MQRLSFRYLKPTVFSGLLDDPLVLLQLRPSGRSLLLDCGASQHLAKRAVKGIDAVFVSHAHMDHFMGFDTLVRHLHASPGTVDLYGPPGIAAKVAAKLSAYDWNLAEPYWATFRVHEIGEGTLSTSVFPGPEGFRGRFAGEERVECGRIYDNPFVTVSAAVCDHLVPSVVYRVEETPSFAVDPIALAREGLVPGEWLRLLKKNFYEGDLDRPLTILRRRPGDGLGEVAADGASLYRRIAADLSPAAFGYVTDVAFSPENVERIVSLLQGVEVLACECTFLASERDKARLSRHLCTEDVNILAERIRPRFLLPLHLSKSYLGRSDELYAELDPPAGTSVVRLPEHIVPAPLKACDIPDFLR
jgi:ribonuclease Z